MVTKKELEKEINEKLGLDFEWRKMPKDDLIKFRDGLEDEQFIKRFVAQLANTKTGDKVQEQIMDWKPGMFMSMASQMQQGASNPADMLMGSPQEESDSFF